MKKTSSSAPTSLPETGTEVYSAECKHRNVADVDAERHAYLQRIDAASRAPFEAAREHVALHEGLLLPSLADAGAPR